MMRTGIIARIAGLFIGLLPISSAALAQTTTREYLTNGLTGCSAANTPIVGNGAGAQAICHANGPLKSAAFVDTGTSGATIGLLNAANTWSAAQAFAAITATTINGNTFTTGTGTLTIGAGKTATINNTMTFSATDGSSIAFGAGGTVLYNGGALGTPSSGVGTNITGIPTTALTGTLQAAQEPAHTGQMTNTAGSLATVVNSVTGTTTNNNATAGNVGEYIESVIPAGSPVALASGSPSNITSISLPAGDWDVNASGVFGPAVTTSQTNVTTSISLTSATLDFTNGRVTQQPTPAFVANAFGTFQPVGPLRFSLASTTTVFLVMQAAFTVSTANGSGMIRARRVR